MIIKCLLTYRLRLHLLYFLFICKEIYLSKLVIVWIAYKKYRIDGCKPLYHKVANI